MHDRDDVAGTGPSHFPVDDQRDISRVITRISWWALPLLAFFALRAHLAGSGEKGAILLGFGILMLGNTLIYRYLQRDGLYKWLFIALIIPLFVYMNLSGLENGAGILWLYVFPPLVFYISNLRVGILLCAFGLLAILGLFTPVGVALGAYPYSEGFQLVYLSAMVFEMVFCFMLDRSRRRNRDQLMSLARQFEYAAKHDGLTGLYNRREGTARLNSEYARWQRHGGSFAILLLDIDRFKRINDTWGHEAGDLIIRVASDTLTQLCRKSDTVARWGGEEFLIILPETSQDEAMQTAERIRERIAALEVDYRGERLKFTASIGVAPIQGGEPIDSLLRRADENLYAAKSGGRNRVV